MTSDLIFTLIGSYCFPIVACIAMAWYCKYITDKNHEEVKSMRSEHNDEMRKVTEALENNTRAVEKLCLYFEVGGRKDD